MPSRAAKDRQQTTLDFGVAPDNPSGANDTEIDIDFDFRRDLRRALLDAGVSRPIVAARMTEILFPDGGGEVTGGHLNNWAAASKDSWRMPATHLPAFVAATGAAWIFAKMARRCGCLLIPEDEAPLVELGRLIAERESIDERERAVIRRLPRDLVTRIMRSPRARR